MHYFALFRIVTFAHFEFWGNSFIHSVTAWTAKAWPGDGSLRLLDVAITGEVPSSICSKPDIDLTDPSLSRTTSWMFPFRSVRSRTVFSAPCRYRSVHVRILKHTTTGRRCTSVNHGFGYWSFVTESGSSLIRLAIWHKVEPAYRTPIPRISHKHDIRTSGKPRVSVRWRSNVGLDYPG